MPLTHPTDPLRRVFLSHCALKARYTRDSLTEERQMTDWILSTLLAIGFAALFVYGWSLPI